MNEFDDLDSVEPVPERTTIPKGDYKIALEKVNQETVKNGDNAGKTRYNCQFTITDERQTGRKIFMDFMPHNKISCSQVKSLALATNTLLIGNMLTVLNAAIDKNFIGNVGIRKDKSGEYEDQNTIWAFKVLQFQAAAPILPPVEVLTGADGLSKWVKDATRATN